MKNLIGFIIVKVFGCIYFSGTDVLILLNIHTLEVKGGRNMV